ncbi:hypothetical protein Poli38472_014750 [Pythium oligandrum]|uniref:AB hydrolase-1 domain-containing protein n=1 Tax=Pythium oligandrum TaxID=41045 RepID=A0A8K1C220_PYTOL|nr:hypothetical protein Poli38472_014750 [Pythium oligandrum]|eukprot:TMW54979.1 hypothetical protein Poli38472_014750 [Pythium oligandrum]
MRVYSPLVLGLLSASAVAATSLPINGWYPCSGSNFMPPTEGADELPFECAEVKVPLCHEGICDSDTKIDVYVKRILAQGDTSVGKSVWFLQGGPGLSSAAMEPSMQQVYALLNGTTNVYTMDHRGTGRSTLLKCDAAGAFTSGSPDGATLNATEAASCVRDVLFQIENQTVAFSITSAAQDVVLLTSELNKDEEVYVYGASYGTLLTERVMHLAPPHVKGYILDGVISEKLASFAHFGSIREAPGQYFAGLCDADSVCREKYGSDVPKEQKMYDVWVDTYKKLDAAKAGDSMCADLLRGQHEKVKPSDVLRVVFGADFSIGDPTGRKIIPAFLQMVRRCDETDVATLSTILGLGEAPSYYDKASDTSAVIGKVFDPVNDASWLLMFAIKISEIWSDPLPKPEDEKAFNDAGVFTSDMSNEYLWHCVLSGKQDNPSCSVLTTFGESFDPPIDLSSVELIDFTYKPDQYFRHYAKIPDGTSVMVINGKLDFQTVEPWGIDQYENMEGDNKMLVEFDYGAHCVGISQSTAEDTTNCGHRIIASYVENSGDIAKTDTSCLDELPAIDFDADELLATMIGANDGQA